MAIPPRRPEFFNEGDKFEYYIPMLLLTRSPLLATQKKCTAYSRTIINVKRWYAACDPLVRSFVFRGAHDDATNFKLSHEIISFVPGQGGERLEIVTDTSTGVSFSFESSGRQVTVNFRTSDEQPWIKISNNKEDFMFLMSLRMTITAILRKDSELSHMREVEAARNKVLAMYGNK